MEYKHLEVEKKWQQKWEENKTFKSDSLSEKPKFYALDMFPYPSGEGLHVGHPEGYTATDIISRMKRMQGFEVMHPMGWDAFGLPAEQYALKTGNHPGEFTKMNIETFKNQIKQLGFSYDWDREISTTDENYYKWTQWIFVKLFENGLAERKEIPVNYCPECGTVLANEEVIDGKCERAGHDVIRKPMLQWELKITKYADRLIEDLEDLDWPESLKDMQRNWIGRSVGANVKFNVENSEEVIEVFTTRVDTIYGVEAVVLAPEHKLVKTLLTEEHTEAYNEFISVIQKKSDLERTDLNKDKSGMFIGSYAINPVNGKKLPIWIGDYVLVNYSFGAVMFVPAHDERDFEFAKKYNLEMTQIIEGDLSQGAITTDGVHINSDILNGLNNDDAKVRTIEFLEENNCGSKEVNYKLRDWLFSRQRYWGEPIPVLVDSEGNVTAESVDSLPIILPQIENIAPGADGTSPLANALEWLEVEVDGKKYLRETNTMPQWAGSCWYYLRYLDPTNDEFLIDKAIADKWLPVDLYIGGAEHAVLHLLYARFWHKFLYDLGVVSTKEPFYKLYNQGMILGENNEKMSKSKGNVINPNDIINSHGADTLRMYEMFMGPLDASIKWSEDGLDGSRRFIDRVFRMYNTVEIKDSVESIDKVYHQTVQKVTGDYEKLNFNTAISQMMILVNAINKEKAMSVEHAKGLLTMLNPIIPHVTNELNEIIFKDNSDLAYQAWPIFDESKLVEDTVEIVVQVNGKIKLKKSIALNMDKDELLNSVKEELDLLDATIIKEIVVPNKLVNLVVK